MKKIWKKTSVINITLLTSVINLCYKLFRTMITNKNPIRLKVSSI